MKAAYIGVLLRQEHILLLLLLQLAQPLLELDSAAVEEGQFEPQAEIPQTELNAKHGYPHCQMIRNSSLPS